MRRDRGLTIDEIATRLALSRTTVYYWVRDIPISRKPGHGFAKAHQRKGNRAMRAKYLRIRDLAYNAGRHNFHALADYDPTFRDFVSTFICEGYKRNRNCVEIANSDPVVIELATRWLRKFARNKIHFALQYHADQDPQILCAFWGNRLGVNPDSVRLQRKSNSNQLGGRTWRSRFGVMTVGTNDTRLRAMVQGWVDEMQISWLDWARAGRSEVWSSRQPWELEIAGSNPAAPTSPIRLPEAATAPIGR